MLSIDARAASTPPTRADAKKVPNAVLDVTRIELLMGFKLFPAVFIAARVVLRDSALPVLRQNRRLHLNHFVEISDQNP